MGINFKELKDSSGNDEYTPLPQGRYNLEVESGEKGVSKNGNDKIEFTFRVVEGDYENRKLWHTFSLVPKAQVYLLNFLEAIGSDVIEKDEEVSHKEIIQSAVGKSVSAYVEITSYPGSDKKRNQISGGWKAYESQDTAPKASNNGSNSNSGGSSNKKKKDKLFS